MNFANTRERGDPEDDFRCGWTPKKKYDSAGRSLDITYDAEEKDEQFEDSLLLNHQIFNKAINIYTYARSDLWYRSEILGS